MRRVARTVVDAGLRRSPMQRYFMRRSAGALAVLAYHGVDDPERFAGHLDLLVRTMRPVGLDDVLAAAAGGRALPPRSVLITFDDGHRSLIDYATPLLAERGIPAVAFVITGLVDTDKPYWWTEVEYLRRHRGTSSAIARLDPAGSVRLLKRLPNDRRHEIIDELRATATAAHPRQPQLSSPELRRLESAGIEIGNHTVSHPCLDTCADGTIAAELADAHHALTEVLGRSPRAFAYPNGNWDPRAELMLTELGYQAAFRFDHKHAGQHAHPLRMSRLRVNSDTPMNRFATILSGLHPALHRARGRR